MTLKRLTSIIILLVVTGASLGDAYNIGLGRADATGPSVEIAFVSNQAL